MQCQPVVAHGVLYATSPKLRVFALDAATGEQKWSFDPNSKQDAVADAHPRPDVLGARRRPADLFRRASLAVRARRDHGKARDEVRTGGPDRSAARLPRARPACDQRRAEHAGRVLRRSADPRSIVPEGLPSAPGDIRAFDIHTGAQKWAFHTIPHPGEFGYETWPKDAWKYSGGANAWAGVSLDEKRGLVFAATGSAAYDFYGANRHGDNLFANTILCLRAATGERVWHFQASSTTSGIATSPPRRRSSRSTRTAGRRRRRADRQERPHLRPRSRERRAGLPMERSRRRPRMCQAKLSPDAGAADAAAAVHPPEVHRGSDHETHARGGEGRAREWLKLRKAGEFDPPSLQGTVLFPGMDGGGEWGGVAFDPKSGLLYVNANEMAWHVKLAERRCPTANRPTARRCRDLLRVVPSSGSARHSAGISVARRHRQASKRRRDSAAVRQGGGRMPGYMAAPRHAPRHRPVHRDRQLAGRVDSPTPFDVRYSLDGDVRFTDPDGFPAIRRRGARSPPST